MFKIKKTLLFKTKFSIWKQTRSFSTNPSRKMSTNNNQTSTSFKFAAIQLLVSDSKLENLELAKQKIKEAAANGAKVVSLPVSVCVILC
jgi:hypothetical protein